MAYREVPRMEIGELIRRWQDGQSRRRIVTSTGLLRNTVGKYLATAFWPQARGYVHYPVSSGSFLKFMHMRIDPWYKAYYNNSGQTM